ncbi:hypothetical protein B0F90DRAFT_104208 [Multifurca ochricompacta]|uniref:rRNA biogenesis protein RRP36 n=1 Tax=Multifurca ochricompacta TaxID=376703 RepID=A0AAD4MDF1_9AGAM|nr:hypothetical protein B0F90DRAFT_104208 [Multifurca ochricompacta]
MQDEFSSFSFGALRKAQQTLNRIHSESSSGKEYDNSYSVEDQRSGGATGKEIPRKDDLHLNESKEGTVFTSRKSKNAPIEITSKRPVSRRRTVVEIEKLEVRDPRFSQLSGEFDATKFQNHYSFLSDMHQGELRMLRENLNRARKLLASSPRDLFPERVAEVERLALAVKRAESSVSRDKREKVEYEALSVVAKDEREKQQKGKKAYWLKNAEKKKLLIKARFDAMTAQGGTRALKKVIEKKRRKLSQKETKSRPSLKKLGRP